MLGDNKTHDDYPGFQPKITPPKHFSRECMHAKIGLRNLPLLSCRYNVLIQTSALFLIPEKNPPKLQKSDLLENIFWRER